MVCGDIIVESGPLNTDLFCLFHVHVLSLINRLKVAGTAKRGRTAEPQELTRKYTSRQKISAAKKKDLVSLCKSGIIPSEEDSDQE
jgi:hypothetical protein